MRSFRRTISRRSRTSRGSTSIGCFADSWASPSPSTSAGCAWNGRPVIEVRLEALPARRLLARAHAGDYLSIGATFEQLYGFAFSRNLIGPDTVSLAIYYDDPDATPAERLRSHACLTVPAGFGAAPEGFELLELEGGEHAIGLHRGPYDRLHESYRWLFGQWLPSSGREPANRAVHEIYVNDPRTTPPADLVTHVCIPLLAAPHDS